MTKETMSSRALFITICRLTDINDLCFDVAVRGMFMGEIGDERVKDMYLMAISKAHSIFPNRTWIRVDAIDYCDIKSGWAVDMINDGLV